MNIFADDCLLNRVYLITGASSGIGRATAQLIAACGGRVILGGRDVLRLEETRAQLDNRGPHALEPHDFSNADAAADWVKELVSKYGPLNGVFHSAGTEMIRPVRLTKQEHLELAFQAGLYAAFGIARAVSQKNTMHDGSSIVLMSSVASSAGQIGMTAYSAAKAGVEGLARSLAVELAGRRIRVNTIVAGAIKTPMHDRLIRNSGELAALDYEKAHLLGFGEPTDIANAVVFLLSDASKWVTGTAMVTDGGYLVR